MLWVQLDHLSGEAIGPAIEMLYEAGASNVNVISTVTKKNRPGYIFVIDVRPERLEEAEEAVKRELQVSGWHRINTLHCYCSVEYRKEEIKVSCPGEEFVLSAEYKIAGGDEFNARPEARSCAALRDELSARGLIISLREAERRLWLALRPESNKIIDMKGKTE